MPINCGGVFCFLVSVAGSINTRVGVAGFGCKAVNVLDELEGAFLGTPLHSLDFHLWCHSQPTFAWILKRLIFQLLAE